uniref:tyrosine-protein phosphatase non-receptor type 2 isoform X3 n=1 Tax=Pristiophorus japonicus TaxID=55135 RepID=UPI00398F2BC6
MEEKFAEIDGESRWPQSYLDIRNESQDFPYEVAKYPENRIRNRYRDVSPFDHSRVKLQKADNDYINASLIVMEEAQRNYILTQTAETREIFHFHYTTWPDFGVPESPASFLNFLLKVRESGSLSAECGPAVVHCSAGIGRSGTFSLVDTCLLLMEKRKDPSSVDIRQVLLEMRKYRMGLIQTPDQLRFSYMAVIEGAKYIMGDSSVQNKWKELSNEDQDPATDHAPPPPKRTLPRHNENRAPHLSAEGTTDAENNISTDESFGKVQDNTDNKANNLRKRHREDRIANTAQKVQRMKQKLSETEMKRKRWLYWRPVLINVAAVATLAVGAIVCCSMYFQ